jgi:hypothetical protein
MTIANQGDVVKYSIGGTLDETAVGVVIMTPGSDAAQGSTDNPTVVASTPYPSGAVALSAGSAVVANASAAATLTGTATTTVYISGFEITGAGATVGLPVTVTVAGLLGGTRSFIYSFAAGALVANTPLIVRFNPPLPASAVNTAIVVTCPAGGAGNTANTANAQGFYL